MPDLLGFYLKFPNATHESEYFSMMREWLKFGGRLNPSALKNKGNTYIKWLSRIKEDEDTVKTENGKVPQSTFFLMKKGNDRICGAISIRHLLNEGLLHAGGNIGYGIRPSERRKGYASIMLSLAIGKCIEYDLKRVLITCDKDNVPSAKVIKNNGGVFENEVINHKGAKVQRYWIDLSKDMI